MLPRDLAGAAAYVFTHVLVDGILVDRAPRRYSLAQRVLWAVRCN